MMNPCDIPTTQKPAWADVAVGVRGVVAGCIGYGRTGRSAACMIDGRHVGSFSHESDAVDAILAIWDSEHPGAESAEPDPESGESNAVHQALGEICPFCGESLDEYVTLSDDECLHACALCDRHWYVDRQGNVLPADRCPACESDSVTVFEDGRRRCGACGHGFFFDGLTYVDPETLERDGDAC
jgi:ribosomal protein S27AE